MKWYSSKNKLPEDKSLVVVYYKTKKSNIEKYDKLLYVLTYKIVIYYDNNIWEDIETENNLEEMYDIYAWCKIPHILTLKEAEEIEKAISIKSRFEILDL